MNKLGAGLLAAFTVYLLAGALHSQLEANADSERDLFRTLALVDLGEWPQQGPAIDHLPLTLGPGWYFLVAPPLAINSNPLGIHWWHVAWIVVGLCVLYAALQHYLGGAYAFAVGTLIISSAWLAAVMTKIWHNAMLPGMAFLWLGLLGFALSTLNLKRRGRLLMSLWLLTALMLQLHVISLAYLAPLLAIHLLCLKRHGRALGTLSISVSALIALALIASTAISLAGLDWAATGALREQRAGDGPAILETLSALPLMLGSAWHNWLGAPWGWLLLFLSLIGVKNAFQSNDSYMKWVAIQMLLGLSMAIALSSINLAPRYFSALIPALLIMAGLGLKRLLAPQMGVLIALLVMGCSIFPGGTDNAREDGVLTLAEQQSVLDAASTTLCNDAQLRQHAHGLIFGPLQATNYLNLIRRSDTPCAGSPKAGIVVGVPAFPLPPGKQSTVDGGSGRKLTLLSAPERIDYHQIRCSRGGRACPIRIPYRWSHLGNKEQSAFKIFSGPDLNDCAPGKRLTLDVPAPTGSGPLHLVISWYDLSRRHWENAQISARTQDGSPLKVTQIGSDLLRFMAMYEISTTDQRFTLSIEPASSLAVVDLY
ncbi:MAG TPA: hypothetical protein EYN06_07180 [Myxococcales bacterium]|nr:hypothetical protein [Myxococcales bacterium]HIN86247.1 hypothetical protein [Myxococcales bacterium]